MRWREWSWLLPEAQALAAAARLSAAGHHAHAVASAGGEAELCVYAAGGRLPTAARAVISTLPPARCRDHDEATLLRACQPGTPVALAPGVWIDPRGRSRLPHGALRLIVPPAPAFGDGRHPSTRLAARLLLDEAVAGMRVLDLGCGTGALGLLARARGARRVDFADLDPHAVRACRAVCRANRYPGARIRRGDLLAAIPAGTAYDLLIGNLYADLVLRLAADPRLPATAPRLVLSGIAARRERAVRAALRRAGYRIERRTEEAWWLGLLAVL